MKNSEKQTKKWTRRTNKKTKTKRNKKTLKKYAENKTEQKKAKRVKGETHPRISWAQTIYVIEIMSAFRCHFICKSNCFLWVI